MKKYIVIGNPIQHSLSPKLHNYWLKEKKIDAVYEKKKINENELKNLISEIRKKKFDGANVTIPFKQKIISFLDELTHEAKITQSVNTIYRKNNKIIGHNTDISGFELGIKETKYNINNKTILILGAGGVVPSIICALEKMKASRIIVSNRTKIKAENLKKLFKDLLVVDWGHVPDFDMIINATSLGLKKEDKIQLDLSKTESNKFFYDVIYKPEETHFLKTGKELNCKTENGKKMFVFQASGSFKIWHNIDPDINDKTYELLD